MSTRVGRGSGAPQIMFYGGGWPTNIGNAVIGLGAIGLLKAAAPDAHISNLSGMSRWFFGSKARNALEIAGVYKCDVVVFAGMSMCEEFVRVAGPTILEIRRRGIPVILLGTGAREYSKEETQLFGAFLRQVKPAAFISRDQESFDAYRGVVERSEAGIDCGFFVPLAFQPCPLDLPGYVVVNFDSSEIPPMELGRRQVVFTHHDCWGPIEEDRKSKPNTLISDLPYDYLALYAGAECVYSDRVHACVAALAYGRTAQLFNSTPRGSLFAAIGAEAIRSEPTAIPAAVLEAKRSRQIARTADILRDLLK